MVIAYCNQIDYVLIFMVKQKSENKVGLGDVLGGGLIQTSMTSTLATIGIAGLKAAHVIPEHITYKDTLRIGIGLGILHGAVATVFSLPEIGKTERQIDTELMETFHIDPANTTALPQSQIKTQGMEYALSIQPEAMLQRSKS
jgi:hypothetical protein